MTTKKPVARVRMGLIQAAIWSNDTDKGGLYNVTLERSYKVEDQWKSSTSFGRDDLLTLAKVASEAHSRILQLQSADRANQSGELPGAEANPAATNGAPETPPALSPQPTTGGNGRAIASRKGRGR